MRFAGSLLLSAALCVMFASPAQAKMNGRKKASIMSGQMSGIVLSVDANNPVCRSGELRFRNLQTRKTVRGYFSDGKNIFGKLPSAKVMTVPPGTYQITGGECRQSSSTMRSVQPLGLLSKVYGPITVGPGEIAYPGTFVFPNPRGRTEKGYSVYGNPQQVHQDLTRFEGALAQRFVERPIGLRQRRR